MGDSAQQHRRAPGPRQCLLSTEERSLASCICPLLPSCVVHATTRVEESLGGICDLFS